MRPPPNQVEALRGYGVSREQTRTDHLRQVARYLGWRSAKSLELKELDEFLLARAMEHDWPSLLFRLGCEYLRSAKVIRPGVVTLLEKVGTVSAVNYYGSITVDYERELAQLDERGHRPLRTVATDDVAAGL